jgi:hypothetical protein
MKLSVTCEVRGECLWVRSTGDFDVITAGKTIAEVTEKAREHNLRQVLWDITAVGGLDEESSSLMERFEICKVAADHFSKGLRLAVVGTPQQLTPDRFEESVMLNRGATVKVTSNLQEALSWLEASTPGREGTANLR